MPVDTERMREFKESQQKGGEFLNFDEGETLVYIHPPCRDDDEHEPTAGMPFVPVGVHYGVGKTNSMIVSLTADDNPIIEHPFVLEELKKKKVKLTGKDPVKKAIDDGALDDEEADEARLQTRYLWGMTPIGFRKMSKGPFVDLSKKPSIAMVGKMINEGLLDLFTEHGDVTDPDNAILVRICRTGSSMRTKYEVKLDTETAKAPKRLSKKEKAQLMKALGEDCDLFRLVANMVKPPAEVQAILDGVKVRSDDDEEDDEDELDDPKPAKKKRGRPAKKPVVDEDEDEDEEDEPPPPKRSKAKKKPVDEDEEDEEDEDEEPPPRKKKSSKKPAVREIDEDDEDEEEYEEEDEEEDKPPPKKRGRPAKKPVVEDEDEDEDNDDEDEPPPRKKKAAKKPVDDDDEDDEDDDDLDDLEKELEDLEDDDEDEEDEPPPRKKSKR